MTASKKIISFLLFMAGTLQLAYPQVNFAFLVEDTAKVEVPQYEKLEIGLKLPADIDNEVDIFLNNENPEGSASRGLNPFNPEDISVEALFFPPGYPADPVIRVFGFYYKNYKSIETGDNFEYWQSVPTEWNWRIRFSPDQTGPWRMEVNVLSKKGNYQAGPHTFQCVESSASGYVAVNKRNNRFLMFEESGDPFYAAGMNVAFPWYPEGCTGSDPVEFDKHRGLIEKLAGSDAQIVRLVTGPKTYGFEWESINNYDAPFVLKKDFPENIEKVGRLALAWELDQTVEVLENKDLYYLLCFEIHIPFEHFNVYFPRDPYVWKNNPYHGLDGVEEVGDFFMDPEARKMYRNKLRYYFARWGYSSRLAGFEILSELEFFGAEMIDGKKYYPYRNEPEFPEKVEDWHREMVSYLKDELGVRQLVSSSYSKLPEENDQTNDLLDFVSYHRYGKLQSLNVKNRHKETTKYMDRWEKPFIIGECGLGLVGQEVNMYKCMSDPFINDLWATAMMGGFGPGLHWWWNQIIGNDLEIYFNPLVSFVKEANLADNDFTIKIAGLDDEQSPEVEYFALGDRNGKAAMGWVHNYSVYWNNLYDDYKACIAEKGLKDAFEDPEDPSKVRCSRITISGLGLTEPEYTLRWYNTLTGQWKGRVKTIRPDKSGSITLKLPYLGNDPEIPDKPSNYAFLIQAIGK